MRFDRKRQGAAAALALGIAILCGVLAGVLGRGHFAGRYAVPAQGREPRAAVPPPPAMVRAVPPPPRPAIVSPPPPDAASRDTADDDSDRIADAIARATRKALDRGAPVRWHKAGQSGYIVVSDAQDYGDHVCRNVSATIAEDDGETRSGAHLWCLGQDDEDWQPVR